MGRLPAVLIGVALVLLTARPGPAAAMMLTKAPPAAAAPAQTWTGFYVGGNVGYGWVDPTASFTANPPPAGGGLVGLIGSGVPVTFDMTGAIGGVQLGYNYQFNQQWLIGFETDFDFAGLKGSGSSNNNTAINFPFTSTADERVNWFGTERIRFGFVPLNNVLLFGSGGFAQGSIKQNASYVNNGANPVADQDGTCSPGPGNCYTGSSTRVATGWAAGGGFEYAFADHWSIRAEYLYVDLGGNGFSELVPASNTPGIPASTINVQYTTTIIQTVRAALNYRF